MSKPDFVCDKCTEHSYIRNLLKVIHKSARKLMLK